MWFSVLQTFHTITVGGSYLALKKCQKNKLIHRRIHMGFVFVCLRVFFFIRFCTKMYLILNMGDFPHQHHSSSSSLTVASCVWSSLTGAEFMRQSIMNTKLSQLCLNSFSPLDRTYSTLQQHRWSIATEEFSRFVRCGLTELFCREAKCDLGRDNML